MIEVTADLNSLGNPQIFKRIDSPYDITISNKATNVVITITPIVGYNAANTDLANNAIETGLGVLGISVAYNASTIVLTGSLLSLSNIVFYSFDIRNAANTFIDTQIVGIEIRGLSFNTDQTPCSYCTSLEPINNDIYNSPIKNRGIIEYYRVNTLGDTLIETGGYNTIVSYCPCDGGSGIIVKGIFTIREIPNCGGTSPIIFQIISTVTFDIVEYVPIASYEANFNCCVSKDSGIQVTPVDLDFSNDAPNNLDCDNKISLQYIITDPNSNIVESLSTGTGTIVTVSSSPNIVGTGTNFTLLPLGISLYDSDGELLGIVESVTDATHLVLEDNALISYSGAFQQDQFFYLNPDLTSIFSYTPSDLGTYVVQAILRNCCETLTKTWNINICNSFIVETGTCNNPIIKNLSAVNTLKITLTTYDGLSLLDSVTEDELFLNVLVSPLSQLELGTLADGFYKLVVEDLDEDSVVVNTTEQVLFYDCNIKTCEVSLIQDILCFDFDTCDDQQDYLKRNNALMRFGIYRDMLYSFWNNIKYQQSLPDSWDIEEHLQEIKTYTEVLTSIQQLCSKCTNIVQHCTSNVVITKTTDCGCK